MSVIELGTPKNQCVWYTKDYDFGYLNYTEDNTKGGGLDQNKQLEISIIAVIYRWTRLREIAEFSKCSRRNRES